MYVYDPAFAPLMRLPSQLTCQAHCSSQSILCRHSAKRADSVTSVKQHELSRAKCNQRGGTSPMAPLAPLSRTTTRQARTRHHCRSGRQPLLTAKQASTATMSDGGCKGVCKRCSGIDSRSEGVVDVLGAMVERGERAAHARGCFRSPGASQADRLHL